MEISQLPLWSVPIISILAIWTLFWKAAALWSAARKSHRIWFILLMVINTVGILEIVYLFVITRTKSTELFSKK